MQRMILLRACIHILFLRTYLEISRRSASAHPSVTYWFRPDRVKLRRLTIWRVGSAGYRHLYSTIIFIYTSSQPAF